VLTVPTFWTQCQQRFSIIKSALNFFVVLVLDNSFYSGNLIWWYLVINVIFICYCRFKVYFNVAKFRKLPGRYVSVYYNVVLHSDDKFNKRTEVIKTQSPVYYFRPIRYIHNGRHDVNIPYEINIFTPICCLKILWNQFCVAASIIYEASIARHSPHHIDSW
jgi:hypothetical protein